MKHFHLPTIGLVAVLILLALGAYHFLLNRGAQ